MRIGVIGYGLRISYLLGYLPKLDPDSRIVAIADPNKEQIRSQLKDEDSDHILFFEEAEEMLTFRPTGRCCNRYPVQSAYRNGA